MSILKKTSSAFTLLVLECALSMFVSKCSNSLVPRSIAKSEIIPTWYSVENEDTRFGANPAFDPSESGSLSPSGRIEWLSANPTLLLITLYDYPQGNGHWSRRIDKLVRYAETHPQVLLDDSLQVYGQWGWNSFLHLYAQRRIHARTINGNPIMCSEGRHVIAMAAAAIGYQMYQTME